MYTYDFYIQAFTSAKKDVHELIDDIDTSTFNTSPAEGKWCIGEVVSHLIQTGAQYLSVMERRLSEESLALKEDTKPFKHPFHLQWFIRFVSPTNKRGIPTLPPFEPLSKKDLDKANLLKEFDAIQDRFIAIAERGKKEQLHLGKIKTGNPVYPILKMSISSCLAINEAHQRRHFEQIKAILN